MRPPVLAGGHAPRPVDVILITGASGVGKTHVSYRLAQHFGMGLTEVDDLHLVLQRATTAAQHPAMHRYRQQPERWQALADADKLVHIRAYAAEMSPYISIVIANHLESGAPLVLEGDFLLPSLMAQPMFEGFSAVGRVCGVVIVESSLEQLTANHASREGQKQPARSLASWHHSNWLRESATQHGIPVVEARPWDTVLERVIAAVG